MRCQAKRFLLASVAILLIPVTGWARAIDSQTARDVARGFAASSLSPGLDLREPTTRGDNAVHPFYGPNGVLLAYVADLSPRGFVIVSANDAVEPVIAYSTEGGFCSERTPSNVLVDMLIQDIPDRLSHARTSPYAVRGEIADRWSLYKTAPATTNRAVRSAADGVYGPLITDEWDQWDPDNPNGLHSYNYYTRPWPVGCVATAMGMIIHYFQYPASAAGDNWVYVNGARYWTSFNDTFDYALMPSTLDSSSSTESIIEVAKLLRDCGIALSMNYKYDDYGNHVSEAHPEVIPTAYTEFFDYTSATLSYADKYPYPWSEVWPSIIESELASGFPVQLGILNSQGNDGHAVICDGLHSLAGKPMYHLNMGWGNADSSNYWYGLPDFNASGHHYELLQSVVHNVRPPNPRRVATPTLTPDGGEYGSPVHVMVSCTTEGARICFDTAGNRDEGVTPDDQPIASGASILVDESLNLRVRAWKPGWIPSDIKRAEYIINESPGLVLKGMAMVAVPIIPALSDPKQVMGFEGNRWWAYRPASRTYAAYPDRATWFDPASGTPGRGFWARFTQAVAVPTGEVPPQDEAVTIHLLPGWNLIGNPFMSPVKWDLSAMMVRGNDGIERPYKDSLNFLSVYAWGWRQNTADPYKGAYYIICDPASHISGEDTLQPWAACWLRAIRECDLIVPPPGSSGEQPPPPPF